MKTEFTQTCSLGLISEFFARLKAAALHSSIHSLKLFSHLKMQTHQCQTGTSVDAGGTLLLRALSPQRGDRAVVLATSSHTLTPICRRPRNVSTDLLWRTSCRCEKFKFYSSVMNHFDAVEGNVSQNNKTDKMVECCKRKRKKGDIK